MANEDIIATLRPVAAQAAADLIAECPDTVLLSGKRGLSGEAYAMAEDILKAGDRQWLLKVYLPSEGRALLQAWVDQHPECSSVSSIGLGLLGVLSAMTPEQLDGVSWHFSGDAFDVRDDGDPAKIAKLQSLASDRKTAGGEARFLPKEGSLPRWHLQIR